MNLVLDYLMPKGLQAHFLCSGTMTVLTMTFLGLESRSDLPRVSYTTALDIYIAVAFVFVLATMVQFAAVHNFTKHGYGEPLLPPPIEHGTEDEDEEEHQKLVSNHAIRYCDVT